METGVNISRTKSKSQILQPHYLFNVFATTALLHFQNHVLKSETCDQPQNAGEKSLLTRDIIFIKTGSNCFSKMCSAIKTIKEGNIF